MSHWKDSPLPSPDFPTSKAIADAVQPLLETVIKGIEDSAITHGCTVDQLIEKTLAAFLNVDATAFKAIGDYPTAGQVKEELAIVKLQLAAAQKALQATGQHDPSLLPELPEA